MTTLKIFMCCHKGYSIVPPFCQPIQGGRAISDIVLNIPGDDTGDNISKKNREYCELTVLYNAWKNSTEDYIGLCHYRRFFCFDENISRPYIAIGKFKDKYKKLLGTEEYILQLCKNYDIIVPKPENVGTTVQNYYSITPHHYKEDIELFKKVLSSVTPELTEYAEEYLSQNEQYFCNMFIMDRTHLNEFCNMMFAVLREFDKLKVMHGELQADRTDGYLGERFLGIYLLYAKSRGAKVKEVRRLDIDCPLKKRIRTRLLPPESKRRFLIKKIVFKNKGVYL